MNSFHLVSRSVRVDKLELWFSILSIRTTESTHLVVLNIGQVHERLVTQPVPSRHLVIGRGPIYLVH
jgi:hypothetical protein